MDSSATPTIESHLAHRRAKRELRELIGQKWPVGSRLPPIRKLAAEMGTGIISVHRAVKELAAEGLLVSKQRLGTFVAAVPDAAPDDDISRQQHSVDGLTGKTIHIYCGTKHHYDVVRDPFHADLADAFVSALNRDDVRISYQMTEYSKDYRSVTLQNADDADALVLISANTRPPIRFDPRQILVQIGTTSTTPVAMPGRFDVVTVEDFQSSLLASRWLFEAGARRVAFLGVQNADQPGSFDATSSERLAGFRLGWEGDDHSILPLNCPYYRPGAGAMAVPDFLAAKPRPDAVFAASDELAVGFINGALSHGLRPGRDYLIMGFDGQLIGRDVENGPLATVKVPIEQMGAAAAELLSSRADDPDQPVRKIQLGCSIFPGNTSGKARQSDDMSVRHEP